MNVTISPRTLGRFARAFVAGAFAVSVAASFAAPAIAQVAGTPAASVRVAQGDVDIVRGDTGAHEGASANASLLAGDSLDTAGASLADVELGGGAQLHLSAETQVRFVDLAAKSREVQIADGTVEVTMAASASGPRIDTPSLSLRPDRAGSYRITVTPDGQTSVTVLSGSATIVTGTGSTTLGPGSTLSE